MYHNSQQEKVLNYEYWLRRAAYLANTISKINEMNILLQNETVTVIKATTKCLLLREY